MYGVLYAYVSDMLEELPKIPKVILHLTDPGGFPGTSPWHRRRALFCAEPHRRIYRPSHQDCHNTAKWQCISKHGK